MNCNDCPRQQLGPSATCCGGYPRWGKNFTPEQKAHIMANLQHKNFPQPEFRDVMLDIETMSTHKTNALILTIGAVEFALCQNSPVFGRDFLIAPSLREQLAFGREVTADTQKWWADPAKAAAKHNWLATQEQSVEEALASLNAFIKGRPVWAHGTNFDISNIEGLFEQAKMQTPWPYNGMRDERTIMKFLPELRVVPEHATEKLIPHDAVDDSMIQVWTLWSRTPLGHLQAITEGKAGYAVHIETLTPAGLTDKMRKVEDFTQ